MKKSSDGYQLSRRGELFRAISHAIRCLNQVQQHDLKSWQRDCCHFRQSIWSRYSDIIEHIPVEFDKWTSPGLTNIRNEQDDQAVAELLKRLPNEIRGERL